MYITFESLCIHKEKQLGTNEVKAALTRFTLKDAEKQAEVLSHAYTSSLFDLTLDCLKLFHPNLLPEKL